MVKLMNSRYSWRARQRKKKKEGPEITADDHEICESFPSFAGIVVVTMQKEQANFSDCGGKPCL